MRNSNTQAAIEGEEAMVAAPDYTEIVEKSLCVNAQPYFSIANSIALDTSTQVTKAYNYKEIIAQSLRENSAPHFDFYNDKTLMFRKIPDSGFAIEVTAPVSTVVTIVAPQPKPRIPNIVADTIYCGVTKKTIKSTKATPKRETLKQEVPKPSRPKQRTNASTKVVAWAPTVRFIERKSSRNTDNQAVTASQDLAEFQLDLVVADASNLVLGLQI